MSLQKEDITNIDRILEMYVKDELSGFNAVEISNTLSIEYSHAQFLIAEIRELNDEVSFLRFDTTARSGNLYPLTNDKFLVRRFLDAGGLSEHLEKNPSYTEIESISQKIDFLLSGQIMLLKGQLELSEEGQQSVLELKELLHSVAVKETTWSDAVKSQVLSALIGIGINSENAVSFLQSVGKSIGIS